MDTYILVVCAVGLGVLVGKAVMMAQTRYRVGHTVNYHPLGVADTLHPWAVKVVRNGLLFVRVQDRLTGAEIDALRWEVTP